MSNLTSPHDSKPTGVPVDREAPPAAPRWVKVFGSIALILVVLLILTQFIGGGHGPGRHLPTGATDGTPAPANLTEHGAHQP